MKKTNYSTVVAGSSVSEHKILSTSLYFVVYLFVCLLLSFVCFSICVLD